MHEEKLPVEFVVWSTKAFTHPSSTHSPACFAFRPPSSSTPRIHSHLTFRDDQGLGRGGGGGCVCGSGGGSGGQVE